MVSNRMLLDISKNDLTSLADILISGVLPEHLSDNQKRIRTQIIEIVYGKRGTQDRVSI